MGINDKTKFQLASEADRSRLRHYLEGRVRVLAREEKQLCGEREEAAYIDGAQMEIMFIYDELLGEQMPDPRTLRKKALKKSKMTKCAS